MDNLLWMRAVQHALFNLAYDYLATQHAKGYDWNWCDVQSSCVEDRMTPMTYVIEKLPRRLYVKLCDIHQLVQWLVDHGANMDLPDGNGLTAAEILKMRAESDQYPLYEWRIYERYRAMYK